MEQKTGICIHCRKEFLKNPRVKNQQYCIAKACQRARRASWQRKKLKNDADYRANQSRCQKEWQERNPGYYKSYREEHPEYVERNRTIQMIRDKSRNQENSQAKGVKLLAKMDSLIRPYYSRKGSWFRLFLEVPNNLANMDSLTVKLVPKSSILT